jgi:TPR repeat protein
MAHLLGQIGLARDIMKGMDLLSVAAKLASVECPQSAYAFSLLLSDRFAKITLPKEVIAHFVPSSSTPFAEARRHMERAAYLNFAPAQYDLGHAYEFGSEPFPFDPLLSMQWYSFASQQGKPEAQMSLAKWFLCGAEGYFEADQQLAYIFAEKAARQGLAAAEFAMGWFAEVGVGRTPNLEVARRWYVKVRRHGPS